MCHATAPSRSVQAYCGRCGHKLSARGRTTRCPRCDQPTLDAATVRRRAPAPVRRGTRYRSTATIGGLPLIHVAFGPHDDGPKGKARGVIAIGDKATGVIAVGHLASGMIAVGGVSLGFISIGGASIGALALGGASMGIMAFGGAALGALGAFGGANCRLPF